MKILRSKILTKTLPYYTILCTRRLQPPPMTALFVYSGSLACEWRLSNSTVVSSQKRHCRRQVAGQNIGRSEI